MLIKKIVFKGAPLPPGFAEGWLRVAAVIIDNNALWRGGFNADEEPRKVLWEGEIEGTTYRVGFSQVDHEGHALYFVTDNYRYRFDIPVNPTQAPQWYEGDLTELPAEVIFPWEGMLIGAGTGAIIGGAVRKGAGKVAGIGSAVGAGLGMLIQFISRRAR